MKVWILLENTSSNPYSANWVIRGVFDHDSPIQFGREDADDCQIEEWEIQSNPQDDDHG